MRRWVALGLVLLGIFLGFASVRVVVEGWREYDRGKVFMQQGKTAEAVTHLVRA